MKFLGTSLLLASCILAAAYADNRYYSQYDDQSPSSSNYKTHGKAASDYQSSASQSLYADDQEAVASSNKIERDSYSSGGGDYGGGYAASGYGGEDKLDKFVHALTAFLPIGLFLAAVIPNVITVSVGRNFQGSGREGADDATQYMFPVLDLISSYGLDSLQKPNCQKRIVCEMIRIGGLPDANKLQKAMWYAANMTPDSMSRMVGLDPLFKTARTGTCNHFVCKSSRNPTKKP